MTQQRADVSAHAEYYTPNKYAISLDLALNNVCPVCVVLIRKPAIKQVAPLKSLTEHRRTPTLPP